jgi:branched-chain amino acid transport system substrate-binding protein
MKLGALLCVVAAGIAVASTAGAVNRTTPGVTDNSILIGGTFPLTGPASLYKTIPGAEAAYYAYINATENGVHNRQIIDEIKDDQYDPSQTVPIVKQLVTQDHVFAIVGSLGTAPGLATWAYLNQQKVPQVLLATGDSYWGTCMASGAFKPQPYCKTPKPWTIGWQPTYPSEARMYAKYILAHKANPQIGILEQNDAYGTNYVAAFRKALGTANVGDIVDTETYNVGDSAQAIGGHIGALFAHGANTVVLFSTPTASIQSLVALTAIGNAHNWNPGVYLNNVSANRVFLLAAEQNGATPDGTISSTYIQSNTACSNPCTGVALATQIINQYGSPALQAQFAAGDSNIMYGLAVAWTFVDALKHAGTTPTRASLMHALRTLNETGGNANPFVYPGEKVLTNSLRTFPTEQLQLQKWDGAAHDWNAFGALLNTGK